MNKTLTRALLAAGLAGATLAVQADGGRPLLVNAPKAFAQDCAACHTAYPPGMLPKVSWGRLMGGLDKHFGTDATLDAATLQQLSGWLQANAGTSRRVSEAPPEDRITRSAWFERKHRQIEPAVWRLASVKSAANCGACHTGADKGDFSEHALKLPPGLSARQARAFND